MGLVTTLVGYSQSTVKGIVRGENNEPIEGAILVYRKDITIGAQSDANGYYELFLPSGAIKVVVRFSGMRNDTLSLNLAPNEVAEVNVILQPYSIKKDQVTVSVGKFDKPLEEQTVTMVVLKPSLIENKNTRSIETALDQTPGLNILDGEPQIRGGSGFTFGVVQKWL